MTLHRASDLLARTVAERDEAQASRAQGILPVPRTGIPKIDDAVGGMLAEGLYVIHGAPGVGKTAFALQVAVDCGAAALFVTCEMKPEDLMRRIASRVSKTALSLMSPSSTLSQERYERALNDAALAASALAIEDARRETLTPAQVDKLFAEERNPWRLMVIDSLHSWALALGQNKSEYEALNAAMDTVRAISSKHGLAVLLVAERNRSSMKDGGLNAVAGTRRVEYGCDCMIELQRPEEKEDEYQTTNPTRITASLSKNRFGPPGIKVPLHFSFNLQQFSEPTGRTA